ncbi:hypothetical protein [Streptomyces sp. NPDC057287]|uniref:hypothetical protein n=1 Tax=Streptomyces sp. NPDC057287 TaxID=3346086 RepID=UPI0036435D91
MVIEGYGDGPLGAGEPLLARPGFWSNYLSAICAGGADAARPLPEWFGEDGADVDALSETLFDPDCWPVLRVSGADGSRVVVVFRNLEGDYGTDFLLVRPGRSHPQRIARREGGLAGTGLGWRELVRIADNPAREADGVDDPAARLLVLLPLLDDLEAPEEAPARLGAALTAVGVARGTALSTAERLLAGLRGRTWHEPAWGSPLSS